MPVLSLPARRFVTGNIIQIDSDDPVSGLIINRVYPISWGSRYVPARERGGCSPAEVRLNHHAEQYRKHPETGMAQHRGHFGKLGHCLIMCPLSRHDIPGIVEHIPDFEPG